MDCKHARLLLTFVQPHHPTEVDADEAAALERHLAECPTCAAQADDEQRADERIGAAMRDVLLPENLRLGILKRLARERDDWWKSKLWPAAGVAAAVLIGVVVAQAWFPARPAKLDPEALAANLENPHGLVAVPSRMKRDLLKGCQLITLQNQQVPCFVLEDGPNRAHILVLSKKQFDWDDARNLERNFQRHSIRVSVQEIDHQFFYIMIYTGGDPNIFVERPKVDA